MSESKIELGTRLTVVPLKPCGDKAWIADCGELPDGWTCELVHRAEADLVPAIPLTGWVLGVDSIRRRMQVSDSNFGFLPISDRMRPRYVSALRRMAELLSGESGIRPSDAEALSEVKGMYNRCARRDQWDWRAVHLALGEPSRDVASQIAIHLGEIASAVRRGETATARTLLKEKASLDLVRLLKSASSAIAETATSIAKARTLQSRSRDKRAAGRDRETLSVMSLDSKAKLSAANATHAELVHVLASYLSSHGYRVEANQFVDAFTRLKSGPAIFEAKSLTDDNELAQVRKGLSQLYEYRFRHGFSNASLWLILSRSPEENWLVDYLEKDRSVHVLWLEEGELAGPFIEGLLESGSDVVRRQ
jgi:hypothetical protein